MEPTTMSMSSILDKRKNKWWGVNVRRAAFAACDRKLRPANEKAAASALEEVKDVVADMPEVTLEEGEAEEEEELFKELCRRWTDSWRLLARAFSCWRMNCASDYKDRILVSIIVLASK